MRSTGRSEKKSCGCGKPVTLMGLNPKGERQYRNRCITCIHKARALRKDYCESCMTKWVSGNKFDTDHIDGNPSNNDPSNVQTLCRSCHIVKSLQNNEFRRRNAI
jgi:hypothetical protein